MIEPTEGRARSITRSLTRRVLLLSLLGALGLAATAGLGLWTTLQRVRTRMVEVSVEASGAFDRFFLDIQSELKAASDGLASRTDLEPALRALQTRNRAFLDVVYVGADGSLLAQRNALGRAKRTGRVTPSWLVTRPAYGKVQVGPVRFEGGTPFVDMAAPVTDGLSLPAGLLVARVDLTALWNATLDLRVGTTGYAYLADADGQLVAVRNRGLVGPGQSMERLTGRMPQAIVASGLSWHRGLGGGYVLSSAQPLATVPWFAVLEQPFQEALRPFFVLSLLLAVLYLIVALIFRDTLRFTRTRIVAPLLGLRDAVTAMAAGRLEQQVTITHADELGQLARSFNRMANQLQDAFQEQTAQMEVVRQSEADLHTAQRVAHVGNWTWDIQANRLTWSEEMFRIYGLERATFDGDLASVIARVVHPEDRAAVEALSLQVAQGLAPHPIEYRLLWPDGTIRHVWAEAGEVLEDEHGRARRLSGIVQDITDRKLAEEERSLLHRQLIQAQKMESLGVLSGGVAHDMNNVLGAILALSSAHMTLLPEEAPVHKAFSTITDAALRGGQLVKRLLNFARQTPSEVRALDLNEILLENVRLLERTTLAKVRLEIDLASGLRPVQGDGSALAHAFMNLCVNAVDAMPVNGLLTLRTRNVEPGEVEVLVEDTGCGMSREVLERAQEPFYTTKEVGKGTGLGLSLVYATMKAHKGQIAIQSEPGQGTRVTLRFPSGETGGMPEPEEASVPGAHPAAARRILLVDDDELVLKATTMMIELLGHTVTPAASGEEALALLEAGLAPETVILDLNMPGLGGAGTLPRLGELCPGIPVFLATGRADDTALDLIQAHPHVTLLPKPFSITDLQKLLG